MKRILSLLCLLVLTSCSSFKEKVGLVKEQPDEYQVITNPPLSVPEDLVNVKSPEQLTQTNAPGAQENKNLSKGEKFGIIMVEAGIGVTVCSSLLIIFRGMVK